MFVSRLSGVHRSPASHVWNPTRFQSYCAHHRSNNQTPTRPRIPLTTIQYSLFYNLGVAAMSLAKWRIHRTSKATPCVGICDGSRLVRGDVSFYVLQGPTKLITSVLPWTPTIIIDYTISLVFWVEEPERRLYPPFFHVWMTFRRPNERAPVDFRSFRMDRNNGTRWQVAVSHCSLIHLYGSQAYGLAITSRALVDDPYQGLCHILAI
jgi:hypothetical protein